MGIPHFSSFITEVCDLRKKYQLSDSFVVIDGCNLNQRIYEEFCDKHPNDWLFGGNHPEYRQLFLTFFRKIKKCGIKPIVVFDGGFNIQLKDNRKERFEQKFNRSEKLSAKPPKIPLHSTNQNQIIYPHLIRNCFETAANEMKVKCFTTKFDADLEMAKLANDLKCPIISNDSDFLVMAINEGVITYDSLKWQNPIKFSHLKHFCIECKIYRFNDFLKKFDLKPQMLPIFGSLMGNDGIDGQIFDELFDEICYEMDSDMKSITDSFKDSQRKGHKRWRRIDLLLRWLSDPLFTAKNVIIIIENYLKRKQIDPKVFGLSIESYETIGKSYLKELLDHKSNKTKEEDIPIDKIVKEGRLPKWFLFEYFYENKLSPTFFTLIDTKITDKRPLIEDFGLDSCFRSSRELFGFLLGLLRLDRNDRTPLLITLREGHDLVEQEIEPKTHISHTPNGDKDLPILSELRQLSEVERKQLLFDILRFDEKWMTKLEENLLLLKIDRQDIDFWKYFLVVIKYWKYKSQVKSYYLSFIRAIVLSLIYYKHHSLIRNDFEELTSIDFCSGQRFKPNVTHYYCEFQTIYSNINKLMSLLGHLFTGPKLHHCLNGVLYYNLFNEIIAKRIDWSPFKEKRLNQINSFIYGAIIAD